MKLYLATSWSPATATEPSTYAVTLSNEGSEPLSGFQLGINGPGRLDAGAELVNAVLVERLSNHTLLAPPAGFVLAPGASWSLAIRNLGFALRHWTDGANKAYVVLADGRSVAVPARATTATGSNAPLRKGTVPFPVPAQVPAQVSIIPWPKQVDVTGAAPIPFGLSPAGEGPLAAAAIASFTDLVNRLFPAEGLVRPRAENGLPVTLHVIPGHGSEAYEIAFQSGAASVSASTETGLLYGLVTLGQILRGARHAPDRLIWPAQGHIADAPGLSWRGTHLDVARHFYASAEIERLLAILAWNKMNRLHWHLSEDEAWRVEIDAYPALTEIGAWRGHGLPLPPLLGTGPERTGGYYSKAAIRHLVALGQRFGVTIVPEIDMPGHCYAALVAVPELRDPAEQGEFQSIQGFPNNCLNPALPETYRFVETVIDEMLDLFPSRHFHLGADEVPLAAWSGSPAALAMLEHLGGKALADQHRTRMNSLGSTHGADDIEGSATAVLQAEFIRRIHAHIRSRGAITGGWEEAAHGDAIDRASSWLVGWRNVEINAALVAAGYNVVVSPGPRYYLDMANSPDWAEPGASWAGWSGPAETYEFDPRAGMAPEHLGRLWGVQTCIWSEPMQDRAVFDRLVFPRLSAVAETGWTAPERKSFARFRAFAGLMPNLYGNHAES